MGTKYINNNDGVVGNKFTVGEAVIGEHAAHPGYYGLWNTEAIVGTTDQYMIISAGTDTFINGDNVYIRAGNNSGTNQVKLSTSNGLTVGGNRVLTVADEGSGNGLDADTLDGQEGSSYLRSDTSDTMTAGRLSFHTSNVQAPTATDATTGARLNLYPLGNGRDYTIGIESETMWFNSDGNYKWYVDGALKFEWDNTNEQLEIGGNRVLTVADEGSTNGLDADTVDGIEGASFLRSDAADTATGQLFFDAGFDSHPIMLSGSQNFDNIDRSGFYNLYNTHNSSTNSPGFHYGTMIAIGNDKGSQGFGLQIAHERTGAGFYVRGMNDSGSTWYDWDEIWTSGTHGSGSGLDADTLDSYEASAFPRKAEDAAITGNYDFSGTGLTLSSHFYTRRYDANGNVYFHVGTADSVANILNLRVYDASNAVKTLVLNGGTGAISWNGNTILTTADEGSGNGLDADTLDGQHASAFQAAGSYAAASHNHDDRYYTETESDAKYLLNTTDTLTGDLTVTGNLNIGEDGTTPLLDMMFVDSASGAGWDTRIQMGKSDDFAAGTGVFPTYLPTGAYGVQFQANSDGVFFGIEEYTTGHYRPIIQWGDDNDDTPFRIKHENGSEFTVSYDGIATATTRLSAPTLYSTVATGTSPLTVTSTTLVSNLNADLLDGIEGASFLRSDADDTATGKLYFTGGSGTVPALHVKSGGNSWSEGIATHPSSDSGYAINFFRTRASFTDQTNTWAIGNLGSTGYQNYFGLLRKGLTGGVADRTDDAIFTVSPSGIFKFGFNPTVGSNAIWHAGNHGSGSGLDADTVDGLEVHTGTNNEANKIVRTQANGYIHAGWINTTSGSSSADISRIYASNDGYIRYYTPSNFLNDGGIAEDLFNNQTRSHSAYNNFNDTGIRAGVNYIQGGTNSPTGTGQWYGFRLGLGGNYGTTTGTSGHYASELYWVRKNQISNANYLYSRDLENGTWGSWVKMNAGAADEWTTARTITLGGDLSGSVSIDGSANATLTATVTDDSHTHDGRYYTESEMQTFFKRGYIEKEEAINLAVGWYTIATNTGDRALGEFQIWDTASSDHQSVLFNASHHFGTNSSNDITVLANSRYSGTNFRYIRIKENATYDGAALQVYVDGTSNTVAAAIVGGNAQESGWVLKDWVADGTDPGDVTGWANFTESCKVDLDIIINGGMITTGEIYSGGVTTQYRVLNTADEGSGNGLDADTVDGIQGASFLRSDAADTFTGTITGGQSAGSTAINLATNDNYLSARVIQNPVASGTNSDGMYIGYSNGNSGVTRIFGGGATGGGIVVNGSGASNVTIAGNTAWNAGNDGSGSGLDADLVDGLHSSSFLRSDTTNSLYRVTAGNGNRIRFWDSDSYAIWMSSATDGTWGGRVPGETTSDYNMYFRMSAGTNRGFVFQNSTTEVAGIDASGNIRAIADVIAYSSSDKTFKDELSIIENPLDKIKNINGYNFTWNDKQTTYESGKKDIGVVAQEIEKVLPEIVNTREDGSKAVKYDKIVALLIEGIKELKDEVEELKKKCNDCTK